MRRAGTASPGSVHSSMDNSFYREFHEFESTILPLGGSHQSDPPNGQNNYHQISIDNRIAEDSDTTAEFNCSEAMVELSENVSNFSDLDRDSLVSDNGEDADNYAPEHGTSMEDSVVVNPRRVLPSAFENPIETYDSVVSQMVADGVDWVPADQHHLRASEVRWAAPEFPSSSANSATQPKSATKEANGGPPSSLPTHETHSPVDPRNKMPFPAANQRSPSPKLLGAPPGNAPAFANVQELQSKLSQEQATRKQQDDYIQQLQRYYDNLLAKHAAAEITIDHLRFQSKVNGSGDQTSMSFTGTTPRRGGVGDPTSTTPEMQGRRLISSSLDTINGLVKRKALVGGSLLTFPSVPEEYADEKSNMVVDKKNKNYVSAMRSGGLGQAHLQSRVHLLPLSSTAINLSPTALSMSSDSIHNVALPPPKHAHTGYSGGCFGADDISSIACNDEDNGGVARRDEHRRPQQPDCRVGQSMEFQLQASQSAINGRLGAIEAHIASTGCATRREVQDDLEEVQSRRQGGIDIWPPGTSFDVNDSITNRIDRLTEAIERSSGQPVRPFSLRVALETHNGGVCGEKGRPESVASNASSSPSSMSSSAASRHSRGTSVSSTASVNLNTTATSSVESAETHFSRLLARYNKLKANPGSSKDLESVMQRMLQLSQRYSAQSSLIFSPKSLRRMFETDYGASPFTPRPIECPAAPIQPTHASHALYLPSATQSSVNGRHGSSSSVAAFASTPDSGVPPTPPVRDDGNGRRQHAGRLARQTAAKEEVNSRYYFGAGAGDELSAKNGATNRKQSDSGICGTDSSARLYAPPNEQISRSTTTEDVFADNPGDRNTRGILLPEEVTALDADIQKLREGISRLTSAGPSNSFSQTFHYRTSVTASAKSHSPSPSSSSTSLSSFRNHTVNSDHRFPQNRISRPVPKQHITPQGHASQSRRNGRSSSTIRGARIPDSSSSSDEDSPGPFRHPPHQPHNHHASHSRRESHHRRAITDYASLPLEVIGHGLEVPRGRHSLVTQPAPTRTYQRRRGTLRDVSLESAGAAIPRILPHRRSRSVAAATARSAGCGGGVDGFPACGICGGSGLHLNHVDYGDDGVADYIDGALESDYIVPAVHSHTPRQQPTVRLPIRQSDNAWAERVYGMRELYGSAVSPQTGRAYNTIGHQPSSSPHRYLSSHTRSYRRANNHNDLLPSVSSPQIAPRKHRQSRRRGYDVPLNANDDDDSSCREDYEPTGPHTFRPCASGKSNRRRTESSRRESSSDVYATARCVTEMAQRLNHRLSRQPSDPCGAVGVVRGEGRHCRGH